MQQIILKIIKKLPSYRLSFYIVVGTSCMVLFTYLTPPLYTKTFFGFISYIRLLPGDIPLYLSRFFLSFFLLGLIPLVTALLCGDTPISIGLTVKITPFKWFHIVVFMIIAIISGVIGGFSESIAKFYPYSQYLIHEVITKGWFPFLIHVGLYGLLYYLPWELFFRGFLILPFLDELEKAEQQRTSLQRNHNLLYGIIVFQTIPSTLLHFGHPITELISAIPAGILFGWLVYKTRSIFPAFLLHFTVGIVTDMTIILRAGG